MKKLIAAAAATATLALVLAGCSAPQTPESVALGFAQAMFGDSGSLPSEFMCDGADRYDDDRWSGDQADDDFEVSRVDDPDHEGHSNVYVDFSGDDGVVVEVDTNDMCASEVRR